MCFNLVFNLKGIMSLILVIVLKVFFFALKVIVVYLQNMSIKNVVKKTCIFLVFCVQLVSHHVPISELHAQWHLCLHFHHDSFNPIQRSCWWPISILVLLYFPFLFLADAVKILVRKISIQRMLNFEIISFIF